MCDLEQEIKNENSGTKIVGIPHTEPLTEEDKERLRSLLPGDICHEDAINGIIEKIASGDFTSHVNCDYKGNFEIIKNAVYETAAQLSFYLNKKLLALQTAHEVEIENARADASSEALLAGIEYASRVQRNALPPHSMFEDAFSDYAIIWDPRDIVGGDIYWMKSFDEGTVLCVGDCTGHGTSGALLTMLVVSALEAEVNMYNYRDTADIVWRLDERISRVFEVSADERAKSGGDIKDGCDMAVLFISEDGDITLSSGHTRVLICDGNEVRQIKGQNIYIGEGKLKSRDDVEVIHIEANENNKFYIASDGLFDQPGGNKNIPFGYRRLNPIILENHNKKLSEITDIIWTVYEDYRGENRRVDDFELISFMPRTSGRMSYEF